MTEQEQHPPQQDKRFAPNPLIGAIPAVGGILLVGLHLREPLVSAVDQPVLMSSCLGLLCVSLALWLFWGLEKVVERVCRTFNERHDQLAAAAAAHTETVLTSSSRIQQKTARLCKQIKDAEERLTGTEDQLGDTVTRLDDVAATLKEITVALAAVQTHLTELGKLWIGGGWHDK